MSEYRKYHASPKAKKARAARNTANRRAKAAGRLKPGDGKVVHHTIKARPGGASGSSIRKASTKIITKRANTRKSNKER